MLLDKTVKPPKKSVYLSPKNLSYNKPVSTIGIDNALGAFENPDTHSKSLITLIKPPTIFSKNSYSTPLTQPIGLTYLAAVLERANYKVKIIDCPGGDIFNLQLTSDRRFKVQGIDPQKSLSLIDSDTDVIGISIMFSQEWPFIRNYINQIRKAFPHVKIIVGGEHITAMAEYSLRDCPAIDYAILGEGELSFLELIHKLRSGKSIHDVSGIAWIAGKQYRETGLAPRLAEINQMPWPAWHLINIHNYFTPNFTMGIGHGRNMAMLATRGCPYQCTFCSNPKMWTTRYTMRPVKDVVDEIEHYIRQYGANNIDFYDLTAIVKKDWILDFINELDRRKVKITWQLPSGTRSESLDEPVIRGLAKTGCEFLVYAPESGSQRTLDMIKKRVNLKSLEKSVATAIRHKVVVKINFIIGFPFETRWDMIQTILFVWKLALLKADDCNISTFSPYPGSELFDELIREGAIAKVDDQYFEDLMTQFDFTVSKTYCRHVGAIEVLCYRILGMSIFYILSYLRSPSRIFRLFKILLAGKPFQPKSLFEQRIYDLIIRSKQDKKTISIKQSSAINEAQRA